MIVIADTTPLNYLALVGVIEVLPALYGAVVIPAAVAQELQAENALDTVKEWLASAPAWLEIRTVNQPVDISLEILDAREREAIQLAEELGASFDY